MNNLHQHIQELNATSFEIFLDFVKEQTSPFLRSLIFFLIQERNNCSDDAKHTFYHLQLFEYPFIFINFNQIQGR